MNGPNKLVLHYNKLENIESDKCSSLLGPFVNYEENLKNLDEVIDQVLVFTTLHFLRNLGIGPIS
jgi:hypothetical protein